MTTDRPYQQLAKDGDIKTVIIKLVNGGVIFLLDVLKTGCSITLLS